MAIAKKLGELELKYIQEAVKENFRLRKQQNWQPISEYEEYVKLARDMTQKYEQYAAKRNQEIEEKELKIIIDKNKPAVSHSKITNFLNDRTKHPKQDFIDACYLYISELDREEFYGKNWDLVKNWDAKNIQEVECTEGVNNNKQENLDSSIKPLEQMENDDEAESLSKLIWKNELNFSTTQIINENNSLKNELKQKEEQGKQLTKYFKKIIFIIVGVILISLFIFFYWSYQQPIVWVMSSTWDGEPSPRSELIKNIVEEVERKSEGKFRILIYNNGHLPRTKGNSVSKLAELFAAVSTNEVQMAHLAPYYLFNEIPLSTFFCSIPGGMTHSEMNNWIKGKNQNGQTQEGEGQRLWEALYKPYGIKPFLCGNTGTQMTGWFKKPILRVEDFRGLRWRIGSPLAQIVVRSLGAIPDTTRLGEWLIVRRMANGELDVAEWISYADDYRIGMAGIRGFNYYYDSHWHEPNTANALLINQKSWDKLPNEFKHYLENAILNHRDQMIGDLQAENEKCKIYLLEKQKEIQIQPFPIAVENTLKNRSVEVVAEFVKKHRSKPLAKEIYESYRNHCNSCKTWNTWEELMRN